MLGLKQHKDAPGLVRQRKAQGTHAPSHDFGTLSHALIFVSVTAELFLFPLPLFSFQKFVTAERLRCTFCALSWQSCISPASCVPCEHAPSSSVHVPSPSDTDSACVPRDSLMGFIAVGSAALSVLSCGSPL